MQHLDKYKGVYIQVCDDCGVEFWDKAATEKQERFYKETEKKHQDKMRIQNILINTDTQEFIRRYSKEYGVDDSAVIRSLLAIYVVLSETNNSIKHNIDTTTAEIGSIRISSVRLKSSLFNRYKTWSKITGVTAGDLASDIVNKIVAQLKQRQNENIKQQLCGYLMSA
jgi:hypothetical protein